jgi:hypothetical protein
VSVRVLELTGNSLAMRVVDGRFMIMGRLSRFVLFVRARHRYIISDRLLWILWVSILFAYVRCGILSTLLVSANLAKGFVSSDVLRFW